MVAAVCAQTLFLPLIAQFMLPPLEQTEKQLPERTIFSCPQLRMHATCWEVKESRREMAAPMQEREDIQASFIA